MVPVPSGRLIVGSRGSRTIESRVISYYAWRPGLIPGSIDSEFGAVWTVIPLRTSGRHRKNKSHSKSQWRFTTT